MKGIILAGGTGSRLSPLTKVVNKHLLQVYDKPMIYYPLSILMLAGIREILIICNRTDLPLYQTLLGDGARLGVNLEFEIQDSPGGIVEAFIIGERFINNDNVALILGDNMFIGEGFPNSLRKSVNQLIGGTIYGYKVSDPKAFGVIEFEDNGLVKSMKKNRTFLNQNYAITDYIFYDQNVCITQNIEKSARGELEISSLNNVYL